MNEKIEMNKSIFAALFVAAIAATMIASTVVTSDVLAKKGEAANHIPDQARDHMSDKAKENADICVKCAELPNEPEDIDQEFP